MTTAAPRCAVTLALMLLATGCPAPGNNASKPCEGTGACPSGAPCKASRDCTADAGFQCTNGVCMRPCPAGDACGTNEICGDIGGKRRCLQLCAEGKCATGAGCEVHWPTRKQICANAVLTGACTSVVDETKCTACGPQQFTSLCSNGRLCPANSGCDANLDECQCESGSETVACDGTPCAVNGVNVCKPPFYSCRPVELPMTRCLTEPHGSSGQCKCADGRTLPFACGETSACEHRCANGCSLTLQDCPDPRAPKCVVFGDLGILTAPQSPEVDRTACDVLLGTKKLGESCQFIPEADGGRPFDRDDCDKGLICAATGAPRREARCRKACGARADCLTGEECFNVGLMFPPSGFCLAAGCTLGGTDCGTGKSCILSYNVEQAAVLYCKYDGTGTLGAVCSGPGDAGIGCGPNLSCSGGKCFATCSPQRACDAGKCDPAFDIPSNPGLCR